MGISLCQGFWICFVAQSVPTRQKGMTEEGGGIEVRDYVMCSLVWAR